ncbi:MAG: hypothetical protein H6732_11990 [Alphaproteobacteria bacterium]|nr:hypothetical protein [Alphaproteobacteria bacterium]
MPSPLPWWTRALIALAAVALSTWLAWPFVHDDGFITLRYVARWLGGDGLTWTAGPPVEGYTHPLWLLQLAALGALGVPLPLAPRLLGLAWLVALVVGWSRARAHLGPLLVLVTLPAVARWTVSGLETVSFAVLAVAASATLERLVEQPGDRRLGALCGLAVGAATITRPEGAGLAVAAGLWLLGRRDLRALVPCVGAGSLVVGALLVFRFATYGSWLSTSSSAKLGDLTILFQLQAFALYVYRSLPPLAATALVLAPTLLYGARERLLVPAVLATPLVLAIAAAGGDHMPFGRFWVPLLALALWGAARALHTPLEADQQRILRLVLGVAVALDLLVAGVADPAQPDPAARFGRPMGRFLEDHLPAGSLVAVATAGSTPFFAPSLEFIDTLGLNDPAIAGRHIDTLRTRWQAQPGHRKGDGAYVLSRQPDVIVVGGATGDLGWSRTRWFLTDRELLESDAFREGYDPYGFLVQFAPDEPSVPDPDPVFGWEMQTGQGPDTRPPALVADDPARAAVAIFWLRRDDPDVDALRAEGVPLRAMFEEVEEDPPLRFCDQLWGLWTTVPCDDGNPPRAGADPGGGPG